MIILILMIFCVSILVMYSKYEEYIRKSNYESYNAGYNNACRSFKDHFEMKIDKIKNDAEEEIKKAHDLYFDFQVQLFKAIRENPDEYHRFIETYRQDKIKTGLE